MPPIRLEKASQDIEMNYKSAQVPLLPTAGLGKGKGIEGENENYSAYQERFSINKGYFIYLHRKASQLIKHCNYSNILQNIGIVKKKEE